VIAIGYREVLVSDDLWPGLHGSCRVPDQRRFFLSIVWWSLWFAGSGQMGTAVVFPGCQKKTSGLMICSWIYGMDLVDRLSPYSVPVQIQAGN